MSVLRRLMGETVVYSLTPLLSAFVGVFLIPIYTRSFTPADYGALAQVNTTTALATILVVFGLDNSAAVWFYEHADADDRSRTFTTWLGFTAAASVAVALLAIVGRKLLAQIVFADTSLSNLWVIFAANLIAGSVSRIGVLWFRVNRSPWPVVLIGALTSLATAGGGIALVVFFDLGVAGAIGAQAIGSGLAALVTFVLLRKVFSVRALDLSRLGPMLKLSAPLVLMVNLSWVRSTSVTYFINFLRSRADAGLYQVANSLAGILGLVMFAFDQAWAPFALSIRDDVEAKRIYGIAVEAALIAGLMLACAIGAFAEPALAIIADPRYLRAHWSLVILAFNAVVVNVPSVMSVTFARQKQTVPLAKATAAGAAVTVASLPLAAKFFGIEGAAMTVTLGSIVVLGVSFHASQRVFPITVSPPRVASAVAMVIAWLCLLTLTSAWNHSVGRLIIERSFLLVGLVVALVLLYRSPVKEAWAASRTART